MANDPVAPDAARLALRTLSVDNLRSLQDLPPVPFESDVTVLAGQNGGGKTSFIDALSMLLDRSPPRDEARSSGEQEITVAGVLRSVDNTETLTVRARHATGRVQQELLHSVHPLFGDQPNNMTMQALRQAITSAGIESPGGTNKAPLVEAATQWIAGRPLTELEKAWVALPPETAARLPHLTVFRSQDAAEQPDHVKRLITQESQRLLATEAYAPRLGEIATEIRDSVDPVLDLIKTMIRRYCPGIADVAITTQFDFSRVSPQVQMRLTKSTGESIDLNEAGSGLAQRVGLAMYAATLATLQEAGEDSVGTLLAYDEPDTHLDYQAQRELFQIVRDQGKLPHTQVVVATHSVNLIDTVALQSIRHFRLDGQRTIADLSPDYGGNDESAFIDDLVFGLGLRNSVLLSEKCFLIVEGSTEECALPILFKKITGETLASAGVTLVNTGGAGSVRRVVEVLIQQLKRSVVVLVDEDAKHSPGRLDSKWFSDMGLTEGTNVFFVGTKEFEDAFNDEIWLRVAKEQFPLDAGPAWELGEFASARAGGHGMGQALENLFSERVHGRVTKPQVGEALARTVTAEEIPRVIRSAVSTVFTSAKAT